MYYDKKYVINYGFFLNAQENIYFLSNLVQTILYC